MWIVLRDSSQGWSCIVKDPHRDRKQSSGGQDAPQELLAARDSSLRKGIFFRQIRNLVGSHSDRGCRKCCWRVPEASGCGVLASLRLSGGAAGCLAARPGPPTHGNRSGSGPQQQKQRVAPLFQKKKNTGKSLPRPVAFVAGPPCFRVAAGQVRLSETRGSGEWLIRRLRLARQSTYCAVASAWSTQTPHHSRCSSSAASSPSSFVMPKWYRSKL